MQIKRKCAGDDSVVFISHIYFAFQEAFFVVSGLKGATIIILFVTHSLSLSVVCREMWLKIVVCQSMRQLRDLFQNFVTDGEKKENLEFFEKISEDDL